MPGRFALLLSTIAIVGAACAPAAQAPATGSNAPVATAAKPFTLRVGLSASTSALDPQASIGSNPRWFGIFETLVGQDENGKLIPSLSSEWKNINATTWQFKLDTNRKFQDGTPVTAQDIKFSFDRAMNPDNKLGILTRIGTLASTEIVDPQTFNVTSKSPDPLLVKRAALVVILSKKHVEPLTPADVALKPLGTGPFMVKEFVPNDRIVLVPNPYHPTKPIASEVSLKAIPDASARIAGLRSGELDIINTVSLDQADALKTAGNQIIIFNQGQSIGAFLFTNLADQPTSNKLVRQALNYATDKETLAKTVFKGYTKPDSGQVVQATTVGFNPNIKAYPYDVNKAKQLLAQAGYPNGIKVKVDIATFVAESTNTWLFIQNQWKAAGIDLELNTFADTAQYLDRWYGRAPRSNMLTTSLLNAPSMDADFALVWFKGTHPDPQRFYNNPAFDEPYNASTTETNEAKRTELLQKAIAAMHEDPPYLFLVEGFQLWAAGPDLLDVRPRGDLDPRLDIIRKK